MDDFALGWLITSLIFLIILCAPLKYILLHNNKNKRQQHSFLNIILKQTEYPSSRPSAFPKPAIKYLRGYGEGPMYALEKKN